MERVWRIEREFGGVFEWTSSEDNARRQENYGRAATPYVPESLLEAERGRSKKLLEALQGIASYDPKKGFVKVSPHLALAGIHEIATKALDDYESPSETGGGNGHD